MDTSSYFKAEDTTIGNLLIGREKLYNVSRFQRPYAWGIKQQEELLKDIVKATVVKKDEYSTGEFFMGNFIFQPTNTKENCKIMNIVDGQQRLITVTMILAIIRNNLGKIVKNGRNDEMARNKSTNLQEEIYKYLYLREDGETNPIITPLINSEKEYFFKNILHLNEKDLNEIELPYSSVCNNYYYGYKMLQDRIESYLEGKSAIKKFNFLRIVYKQIKESKVVILTISNEDQAYNIYSNINSKGLYLSPIDLIKNDFLYKTRKDAEVTGVDVQLNKWEEIYNNVKKNHTIPFEVFYKHCWYIIHPEDFSEYFSSDISLFEIFQTKYPRKKDRSKINKFFNELNELSNTLSVFKNTSKVTDWGKCEWLPTVSKLKFADDVSSDAVTNNYSLWLLPLYFKRQRDEKYFKALKKAIPFVTDTVFIYKLLLEFGSDKNNTLKSLEEFFDEIFNKLASVELIEVGTSIQPILDMLIDERATILKDSKEHVISIISNWKYSKHETYIRYLLYRVNDDKKVVLGNYVGSIEHIIEAEESTDTSDSIGNLVVLEKSRNDEAAELKNKLKKLYEGKELADELLQQKFNNIYVKSEYPAVKKLVDEYLPNLNSNEEDVEEYHSTISSEEDVEEYLSTISSEEEDVEEPLPVNFNEESVLERSKSICIEFLNDFIRLN